MPSILGARVYPGYFFIVESSFDQILMGYICHIKSWRIPLDLPHTYYLSHLSELKKKKQKTKANHLIKCVYFHPNGVFMNKTLEIGINCTLFSTFLNVLLLLVITTECIFNALRKFDAIILFICDSPSIQMSALNY